MRNHGHAAVNDRGQVFGIEVRQPQVADLAGPAEIVEPRHDIEDTGDGVVPPVQLHQIDRLHAQSAARAIDRGLDLGAGDVRQSIEVGYALGVDLDARGHLGASPLGQARPIATDQRLDARVDVRTVEGGDAGVHEGLHIGERRLDVHGAMAARELPPALQQP